MSHYPNTAELAAFRKGIAGLSYEWETSPSVTEREDGIGHLCDPWRCCEDAGCVLPYTRRMAGEDRARAYHMPLLRLSHRIPYRAR